MSEPCIECGMICEPGEYHPYAACLMFMGCKNGNTVQANLDAVVAHGAQYDSGFDDLADRVVNLETALRNLMSNEHLDLGDMVYQVREREGLGWDGPSVAKWSNAVTTAKALIENAQLTGVKP